MPVLERLHHDPTLTVYGLGNLCVGVWRDAPKKGQIAMLQDVFFASAARFKDLALANVIVSGTPVFPEDARKEAAALQHDKRARITCTAHVILLDGFAGAATRAFLSGITLVTRTTQHTKVFSEVPGAAAWLEGKIPRVVGVTWRPGDLVDGLQKAAATPA